MKHVDILSWCTRKELSVQVKHADILIRYARNRMTTHVITLWRVNVASLTTSVSTMRLLLEILPILKAIKSNFKRSYDKQNLTLVVI